MVHLCQPVSGRKLCVNTHLVKKDSAASGLLGWHPVSNGVLGSEKDRKAYPYPSARRQDYRKRQSEPSH